MRKFKENARPGVPEDNAPGDAMSPRYTFRPRLVAFLVLYVAILAVVWPITDTGSGNVTPLTYYITAAWSSYLPLSLIGLIGALSVRRASPSTFNGAVDGKVVFVVPTVGRFDVVPALTRVVDSILRFAPSNLTNFRIDVALDEGAEATEHLIQLYQDRPDVRVVIVPASYQTRNGTRYKARANHYLVDLRTREGESRGDVFVYHLDDDTSVGRDTVASIAEFIASDTGQYHVAQGVLTYPRELTTNHFTWLADSVRPADDLTRFHFFTQLLRKPLAGFHGEHLLVRASVEAEIGWDFGSAVKVEDAYFALTFVERYPHHSRFLNSVCYGASPATVRDLVKQRRRWAAGLFALAFDRQFDWRSKVPLVYAMANWGFGLFQHVGVVLLFAYLLGTMNTSPLIQVVSVIWAFNMSFILWMYMEGLRMNVAVSFRKRRYVGNLLATFMLLPLMSMAEAWSATLGLYDFVTRKQGFDVIIKQT